MKNKKITTLCLSLFTALGLVSCGAIDSKDEIPQDVIETSDVETHNMEINMLSTGVDLNDHPYQTFSYVTLPSSSPYHEIDVSCYFNGGGSCSQFLTCTHDSANKTITVTCLQPFSTLITVHLESHYNSSVFANITVHYLPKYSTLLKTYLELYEEDSQNSGQYIERTATAAYEDSFEFTVSANTEGVVSNPRQSATVDSSTGLFIDSNNGSTMSSYGGQTEYINQSLTLAEMLETCPEYYTGNNFSSSFKAIMTATGFDVILPKIMMRIFGGPKSSNYNSANRTNFSSTFRSYLLDYLSSNRIDTDLIFDSTNTKTALINAINDWISNNSVIYIPYHWLALKCTGETSHESSFNWNVNFANGDVESHDDLTDGEMPFYSSVKILMPSPYTAQELGVYSIAAEQTNINF